MGLITKTLISYDIEGMDNPTLHLQAKLTRFSTLKDLLNIMNTLTVEETSQIARNSDKAERSAERQSIMSRPHVKNMFGEPGINKCKYSYG